MSRLTSPIVAKQIEKEITSEARKEENAFRHVVKDFERLEKLDAKAHKTTDKTEKHLNKSEKKEQSTLRDLHKATDRHEQAKMKTTHLVEELGGVRQEEQRIRQELLRKKAEVEDATVIHETNEQSRLRRLQTIKNTKPEVADAGRGEVHAGY